jgi:glucose/arabinose dehydrogenase/cytochrome c551/c552
MSILRNLLLFVLLSSIAASCSIGKRKGQPRILLFTKTAGFRHGSIPVAVSAIQKLGEKNGFRVDTTEDASLFNEDSLRKYSAVVFLNATGDVLDAHQQADFERYIQAGGGFVGIHAAADCEYGWPWYGKLVGAYFKSHPRIQKARLKVTDKGHESTRHLPDAWERPDEWYNFRRVPTDSQVRVLLRLDETTYEGGENGADHPMAWYHEYDGGRAFYTGLGHTEESYSEQAFLDHILGGIRYAIGRNRELDYGKARSPRPPDEDRFTKNVLATGFDEPTEMAILPNLDILVVERKGGIKWYRDSTRELKEVGRLDVYHKASVPNVNAEEGLMGIAADPAFASNNHVFLYYAPVDSSVNRLSRFTFKNGVFDPASEKVVLEVRSQRQICCHTGGSIAFGGDGLLYLSTGDNATPFDQPGTYANHGYAPIDQRPGFEQYDARRSSANANDLRGKILRIRVKPDGGYEVPEGNLFKPGTQGTRPEVYVMGNRNPYRISVDRKTGFLYWGEVGPDAANDSLETRGPRGYDELNQARKAGFFGWPLFVGNNHPYREYDYASGRSGNPFDPQKPVNDSRNNTGIRELPSVAPAFVWYPYAVSPDFPELGTGGRNAMAGPVYHSENHPKKTRFPEYFDGKLFFYDWIRGWVRLVTMDEEGNYQKSEPFMPSTKLSAPIDMEMGPDGRLYILEYGSGWFSKNPDAALSRVDYNPGNRAPRVEWTIDRTSGTLPLTVKTDAGGTRDSDKDPLTYVWHFGEKRIETTTPQAELTFTEPGEYAVHLEVSDGKGGVTRSASRTVIAGNESPLIEIKLDPPQGFFMPARAVGYSVHVSDKEDGLSGKEGGIDPSSISVRVDYLSGNDKSQLQGHQTISALAEGRNLTTALDCRTCHKEEEKSIGPSYRMIASKYAKDPGAKDYLIGKIIRGGGGVWGEVAMAAHPDLKEGDAAKIVDWILSTAGGKEKGSLPPQGTIVPNDKDAANGQRMQITASYTDKGAPSSKPVTSFSSVVLRGPMTGVEENDSSNNMTLAEFNGAKFAIAGPPSGWLRFGSTDLNGVAAVEISLGLQERLQKGYLIELRLDGPEGPLAGQAAVAASLAPGFQKVRVPMSMRVVGPRRLYLVVKRADASETRVMAVSSMRFLSR